MEQDKIVLKDTIKMDYNAKRALDIFHYNPETWKTPLRKIRTFFLKIKWMFQRAFKGYSDFDLWNLDSWISSLLYRSISDFSQCTIGYPENMSFDEWQNKLKTIANCFKCYNLEFSDLDEKEKEYYNGDCNLFMELKYKNIEKGFNLLKENFESLWD